MTDTLLRMLVGATLGLLLALLLRRAARCLFGAGPAFTLWLLPVVLALAPLWPQALAPAAMIQLPGLTVTPHAATAAGVVAHAHWEWVLLAVWLAGVAIALARLAWVYAALCRSAQLASGAWLANIVAAAPAIDSRRVRVHPAGPAVLWALPRARVLLPADFAWRFDNVATRELVLRHELTHVRRGDAWWTLAMEVTSACLWFHPLVWYARPRFRLDQELACDASAVRALPARSAGYARALLDSVAAQPVAALIPWLAEPQLKERIAMLAKTAPGALRRRAGFTLLSVLLAGGAWMVAGQTPVLASAAPVASKSVPPSVDISFQNHNPPAYPADAIKKGEQGQVILDVTVNAAGAVTDVRVDQHGTDAAAALQVAAIQAAAGWKFAPGRANGKAVGGVIRIPVSFSLSGERSNSEPQAAPCPSGDVYDVAQRQCVKPPAAGASA